MGEPLEVAGDGLVRGRTEPLEPAVRLPPPPMIAPMPQLSFTEKEKEIMEHISAARAGIKELGLRANGHELNQAVHTLQMFVIAHVLQRIGFKGLTRWFWSDSEGRPPV